ncbi:MAG: hypothetical protein F6K23_07490 [Okeania sp. SIO2C9]|uniref:hypothetical protein n=1 Tax=Okeania sp. SIO2C9 TaxID=2607791 RepID=UPI0013C03267|nr:hypothetical protein [Okeania sp. SIO2C9]NEQ72927.1 hypothetical protein [Okeania sp. SIO2C9]
MTGGISSLKSILAVFAYVLDIENIYSLEIDFSKYTVIRNIRKKPASLFSHDLEKAGVSMVY